jgi:NitT/TauT family transport system substrate-binding protein
MHQEAPHFLLLSLCERFHLEQDDFEHIKTETAKKAVDVFLAGDADAVVSYEPFLLAALDQPGAHRLASAADDPGAIIDILTIHEDYLETNRPKVQALIAAWFKGLDLLESGDPQALEIACRFLGSDDRPLRVDEYREMASGMRYGGVEENRDFFRTHANGRNEFQERFDAAQTRWDRNRLLGRRTNAADGDGSDVFHEMYGR